jgi:hypothetical protein
VLVLIFFWKIALTNRVLAGVDVFAYFYPYRDFASEALRSGRLPLWNPYLFMGAPLLANSQVAVLYPLHWPLMWLSVPKQVAWSIVLHIYLAGAGIYLFARWAARLRPLPAWIAAVAFALGGFLGAQVEHINQLNASAWLPWLLICLERSMLEGPRRWLALLAGGAVVALMLLAGHTQAVYIVLFGAAVHALLRGLQTHWSREGLRSLRWLRGIGLLAAMAVMGILLSAWQLLPTLELSQVSVRSGGLPYQEAASFSLKPWLIFKAILPPLVWEPLFSEYVAYIGLTGLLLAGWGAFTILRRRSGGDDPRERSTSLRSQGVVALILALIGLFLALGGYNPAYYLLYKLVPGFDLFRAPARWLLLYGYGAAILAGIGMERLLTFGRWKWLVAFVLVVELFVAGRRLAYNNPTAPAAYDSMRSAPAHMLADVDGDPFRFLSMSDILYDPGDLDDLLAMYGPSLPDEAIYDLLVAAKMKEVLAYNLPLGYRLFSVDGYDGGLLPTKDYVALERLFLDEEDIWPDGRLRQQLQRMPPARLLSLLNVKFIITDKMQDAWIDDAYYDLEHSTSLGEVILTDLPAFEATHLGIVSHLDNSAEITDGTPVATVIFTSTEGTVISTTLRAGADTAEGLYQAEPVAHRRARVGHTWGENNEGNDYVTLVDLGRALQPRDIRIRSLLPDDGQASVELRGLSLVDERTGTSRTVSVDPAYRMVHSGDVKIYENLSLLPRAFVVHRARIEDDDERTLELMRDPGFDPALEVIVVSGSESQSPQDETSVEIVTYEPERVELAVSSSSPGYLVLTDSYYPGWAAEVDGVSVSIERANLYFRAVPLDQGDHDVVFRYQPASASLGLTVGLFAWLAWGLGVAIATMRIGRRTPSSV